MRHRASLSAAILTPFARRVSRLPSALHESVVERTAAILAHANLTTLDLIDPEARIPLALGNEVLEIARSAVGPELGLLAASELAVGDLGVYEYLARTAATLRDCVEATCRYLPLVYDGAELRWTVEGSQAFLRYQLRDRVPNPVGFIEFALAACVAIASKSLGLDVPPHEVTFTHSEPSYSRLHRSVFRCPVRFDAPHNQVAFASAGLELPFISADPAMHAILRRYADRLLDLLPTAQPMARAVQKLLRTRMDDGQLHYDDLPRALHMSERTLRRRLSDEGVQLKSLIEETRREQARRYLVGSSLRVSEIAYRLGFAHPPAFHRAFRRWFGASPLHYRRAHAPSAAYRYLVSDEPNHDEL